MHCTGFHIDRTAWRALWAIRWSDACGVEANMAGQTPFPRIFEIEGQGVSSRPCWHSNSSVVFAQHCSSSSSSSPHIGQSVTSLSQLQKVIKISKKPKPKTYFPHHSFSNIQISNMMKQCENGNFLQVFQYLHREIEGPDNPTSQLLPISRNKS